MGHSVGPEAHGSLERSCGDWVRTIGPIDGVELLQARLAHGFAPHRHDTYGISVTEVGVQTFDYRGSVQRSLPGQVTVLHPDERHDGRAGTAAGFGYRIVYAAPSAIGAAVESLVGRPAPLPFVREPVGPHPWLASSVDDAFAAGLEPLAHDSLILRLAEGLLAADRSLLPARKPLLNRSALGKTREYLETQRHVVRSEELEAVSGLSRFELARQFRCAYGTSPYRYSLQRRVDRARRDLQRGEPLVAVALANGFADQAHFTRTFTATFGVPPGRYSALTGSQGPGPTLS